MLPLRRVLPVRLRAYCSTASPIHGMRIAVRRIKQHLRLNECVFQVTVITDSAGKRLSFRFPDRSELDVFDLSLYPRDHHTSHYRLPMTNPPQPPNTRPLGGVALEPVSATSAIEANIQKLQNDLLDAREKMLAIREKDLLELRERVATVSMQVKLATTIFTVLIAIAGVLGISKLSELNQIIETKMITKMDESIGYYSQVSNAIVLANNSSCGVAIPLLRKLLDDKPADEVVFGYLTKCLNDQEDYQQVTQVIQMLKDKGLFPGKYTRSISFNNSAYSLLFLALDKPQLADEAYRLLLRGDQIASIDEPENLSPIIFNLLVYHLVYGNPAKAKVYADRLKERDPAEWAPWIDGWTDNYGKKVFAQRRNATNQLKQLLAQ